MVDPEGPVGPDVTSHGVDADSDGHPDTVVVTGLATPTIVVDLDRDGRGDLVIEVSPAGETRMTELSSTGGDRRWAEPDPEVSHWSDPELYPRPGEHLPGDDVDPLELLDCLLNLFS